MAVTRIKTNQITDSSVTNAKIADYSIQGGKLANSFTYGSDLTVSGNLTVNGTTTTVDTVNTTVNDPILLVGSNQTGAGSLDLGILGERGDDTNVFVGYDESADEFVTALTSSTDSSTTVTITDYADMHVGGLTVDDNATVGGTATVTGNITGGNLTTAGTVQGATITDGTGIFNSGELYNMVQVTVGNSTMTTSAVTSGTLTDGTASLSSGALTGATNGTFSGTVTGGTLTDGTASISSGAMTGATNITASGNITGGNLTTAGDVTTATVTASGNVSGGNLTTAGTATVGTLTDGTGVMSSGELYNMVQVTVGNSVMTTSSVTSGSLTDGTATLSSGALSGATTGSFSGNVNAGNFVTTGTVDTATLSTSGEATLASATVSDLTSGRVVLAGTSGAIEDSTNLTFDGSTLAVTGAMTASTTVTATGNITGGNLTTAGDVTTATLSTSGAATLGGTLAVTGNTTVANFEVNASSTLEFNQNVLGNVADPSSAQDAATKNYVDSLLSSGFTIVDSANNSQSISQGDTLTLNGTTNEIEVAVSATDTVTIGLPSDVEITNNLTVGGNLIVQGSQTIVDATSTSIVDPIIQLGRGANNAALTSNDGKDRGVAMYYYNGSEKVAYLGWDDPSNEFRFIPDATISSESVTGSLGTANLGKVRVDSIDIDSNSITTTSGNLELTAASGSHVKVPTGDSVVIEDISDTHIVYSNAGQLEGGAGLTYDGTEFYADNMYSGGYLNVDGTANVGNIEVAGASTLDGALTVGTTATVTGNITGGNLTTAGHTSTATMTASGAVTGGSLTDGTATLSSGALSGATTGSFSGNVTGGNLSTAGTVTGGTLTDGTGILQSGELYNMVQVTVGNSVMTTSSVTSGSLTDGTATLSSGALSGATNVTASGTVTGGTLTDGTASLSSGALSGATTVTASGNITGGNLVTAGDVTTATVTASGAMTSASLTASGNVSGGNLTTAGTVTATGNITGGNLTTAGTATVGVLTDGNGVMSSGELYNMVQVTVGNSVITTSSVTSGSLTDGTATLSGGDLSGVTSLAVDNITIDGDDITTSGSALTINEAGSDVDFRVESSTNANMLVVDAGADSVMIGTATATTDVSFKVGTTDAMMIPVGTTAQRPATGAGGMIRYNSSTDQYESYDVSEARFKPLGVPEFTVIASESFDGDGSTTAFTLSDEQTTASCIISINGVVQLPTSAYSVSGNALTFTEAPETGDKIEVRKITTTTTVASLSNGDQSVTIECGDSQVDITGDVVIAGNLTFSGQNFLGQYNHSNVYITTSTDATNNASSTLAITAATLGFDLTQASYYQVFLNRQLLRPSEVTVNLTNGTLTFASETLAENDEIEAVFLAT